MIMRLVVTGLTKTTTTTMNETRLLLQLFLWVGIVASSNAFWIPLASAIRNTAASTTSISVILFSHSSPPKKTASMELDTISSDITVSWNIYNYNDNDNNMNKTRRDWLQRCCAGAITSMTFATIQPKMAEAAVPIDTIMPTTTTIEAMKTFLDPDGLFAVNIPQRFFAIRRKVDSRRQESLIFTAGDLAKAELIAIERFPTRLLLEENGIAATGNLSTVAGLGTPAAVAKLIAAHRDVAAAAASPSGSTTYQVDPESIRVSPDEREISFVLSTRIDVQKPELLLEQMGVSELYRFTAVRALILPPDDDPFMMAIFGSALQQDWLGPDGTAIRTAVQSLHSLIRGS